MDLRFSISPNILRNRNAEISALIANALPGSFCFADVQRGVLRVTVPQGVDPMLAADTVCRALGGIGITAYYMSDRASVPPIQISEKKQRSVPLSVFILSLVAVALVVSMLTVLFTGVLSTAFSGLGFGNESTLGTGEQEGENYAEKIALIDSIFEHYSLYDTNGELLLDEMLKAYAAATGDTYAKYYTEAEYAEMISDNNAKVVGIGISAVEDSQDHDILVINVMSGSPALAAGLQPGDHIITVGEDKAKVSDIGYEAAIKRLQGEEGTNDYFAFSRNGTEMEFSVVRATVQIESVTGRVSETDATVGVVRITQFDTKTPLQLKTVMNSLLSAGCIRFVFDVRSNPGGDLKSISAVLSYFLQENDTILSTVKKDGTTTYYQVREVSYTGDYEGCSVTEAEIGMFRGYPMVVLTNQDTASAAELFTAALKDYGLATVMGTTTYGKGVLQNIISLETWGYKGAVKLTVGYYSPPSGINYDGVGIAPDIEVTLDESLAKKHLYLLTESEDNQLRSAIQYLQTK